MCGTASWKCVAAIEASWWATCNVKLYFGNTYDGPNLLHTADAALVYRGQSDPLIERGEGNL